MRPIGFHSHTRRILKIGRVIPFLIVGALVTVFLSPFLIGEWIHDRLREKHGKG